MLRQTLGIMRELPRLHEIASVFIRHGLGEFVHRIGIAGVLERAGHLLHRSPVAEQVTLEPAQRMRMALEELGPTFVKLGQVMATRVDLFPPRWIAEFEKLHADVPAVPFEELLPELERALGRSPFEVFRDIDRSAHGAASIAQVHRAKLQDGTPVVLKVRRPGGDWELLAVGVPGDREVDDKRLGAALEPAEYALLEDSDFAKHPFLAKG